MSLFSAAKMAQLKNTPRLHFVQTRLLSCALFAHQCNSFQNSHIVQLLHFKDEFIARTGYNRKYAIHVLKNSAYVKVTHFNNAAKKSVQIITKTRQKRICRMEVGQGCTSLYILRRRVLTEPARMPVVLISSDVLFVLKIMNEQNPVSNAYVPVRI